MRWNNFTYLVKQGIVSVWYNRMMSFASFCILMVSLLMVGLAGLTALNINIILSYIEQKNEIMVYVKDELSPSELTSVSDALNKSRYVTSGGVVFYPKEKAWQDWRDAHPEAAAAYKYMDNMGYNPLPDTYIVTINDLTKILAAKSEFERIKGVDEVIAPQDFAQFLVSMRSTMTVIGGAVIFALIIVCLVIIYNSSRASVFSRRTEINIMKYVGATNAFVKIPFFIEGIFIGIIAGAAAWFLTKLSYDAIVSVFDNSLTLWQALGFGNLIKFADITWLTLAADCAAGAVLSAAGIMMSMGKHLKV